MFLGTQRSAVRWSVFIPLFQKYLLGARWDPNTVLDTGNTQMNRTAYVLVNKYTRKKYMIINSIYHKLNYKDVIVSGWMRKY